jgi:hypothetical protein
MHGMAGPCEHGKWTFRFNKRQGISWVADRLLASQEGFWSVDLVSQLVNRNMSTVTHEITLKQKRINIFGRILFMLNVSLVNR